MADARERLKSLEGLLDDGLISGDEYAERRKRILDELLAPDNHEPAAPQAVPIAEPEPLVDHSSWKGPIKALLWVVIPGVLFLGCVNALVDQKSPTSTGAAVPYSGLLAEYGGQPSVYARIASKMSCTVLQAEFDRAGDHFDRDGERWSIGYMTAADERMSEVGCY